MIANGTLCFLIARRSFPIASDCVGRVVEVTGPAIMYPPPVNMVAHEISAPWLNAKFPRRIHLAEPRALIPIAGPEKPAPAPPQRLPLPADA